jgi:hypothetical protein
VPIQNAAELMTDAQVAATGMLAPEPGSGVPLVGMPFNVDGEKPPLRSAAPSLDAARRARAGLDAAISAGADPFESLFGSSDA